MQMQIHIKGCTSPSTLRGIGRSSDPSLSHPEWVGATKRQHYHQGKGTAIPVALRFTEKCQDPELQELINYVERSVLPTDPDRARRITLLSLQHSLVDGVLFLVDTNNTRIRAAAPCHLRNRLMEEHHRGPLASHSSGDRLFSTLSPLHLNSLGYTQYHIMIVCLAHGSSGIWDRKKQHRGSTSDSTG